MWPCCWDWCLPLVKCLFFPWHLAQQGDFHTLCCWYTEEVEAFPSLPFSSLPPQAFWGRAAWGRGDVGSLCGLQAVLQGVKQCVLCLESISSN